MALINYIVPLISKYLPFFRYALNYVFCLAFIATLPMLVRYFLRR